ncbi:MAG: hypothetical protein KAX51_14020 [Chromatiaceae bacterium]|jgi:hypothetical protein|nr:hypothetical protein [Chromatiaceae bacterium]
MTQIANDQQLRAALNALTPKEQRLMGARFAGSVMHLCLNDGVRRAGQLALDPDADPTSLDDAVKTAKSHTVKTYTDCGKDTNWLEQADHFVAAALVAALTPADQLAAQSNPAWKAAVQARMAKNCEIMVEEEGEDETESDRQYRIASQYL